MSQSPLFEPIVLTLICDDRTGIINRLSHLVEEHGGNWTESSMASLAGKFAGILLASVPAENCDSLISSLEALGGEGMSIHAHRSNAPLENDKVREFALDLLGQDRPGIVRDITAILHRHGVNVLELETHCESASMSGEMLFKASARLLAPPGVTRAALREDLEKLANELMVDISLND